MRQVRFWIPILCALLLAGCTDAPTTPRGASKGMAGLGPSRDDQRAQGCVIDGYCVLPPISGGGCDPHLELDWSCDDGGGDCMTALPVGNTDSVYVGLSGCIPDPTKPGGGTEPLPSEPEPGDSCSTGDPIVDAPTVSQGLRDLWARSNPDANLAQRREAAGYIVQTAAGFAIVPITTTSAGFGCVEFTANFPATGTVVGFVHTHPYQVDETIIDCDLTTVQAYTGAPSDADRRASSLLGSLLGRSGPLPGYIIDKDGYYRFDGAGNTATPRIPRCGY